MKMSLHHRLTTFLLAIIIITSCLPTLAFAAARSSRVVRVGFPMQNGLSMRDEQGRLSGYTYDYLMEISQFTGWSYEFVFVEGTVNEQLMAMLEMLEKGEIDLLGGLNFSDALSSTYSYPGYCYGYNYAGLFVPEDSPMREASLYSMDTIRVAVHRRSLMPNEKLEQFALTNNLNIEQLVVATEQECSQLLASGEAHALLSTDLTATLNGSRLTAIAHFSPEPFYLVTTAGNTQIIQQLNNAISTIDRVNSNFMVQLYNNYFSQVPDTLMFSEQEQQYMTQNGTLEVVMYDNKAPFEYLDRDGKPAGVTVEVLDLIAESLGLTLHYNTVSTYEQYLDYAHSGKADIAANVLMNYMDAQALDCTLTLPWGSLPLVLATREDSPLIPSARVALPYGYQNIVSLPEQSQLLYYDTVEQCLEAVQEGAVDYALADDYGVQYTLNSQRYGGISKLHQNDVAAQKLAFGICDTANLDLLSIINKGVTHLSRSDINEIIYRHTYQQQELSLGVMIYANRSLLIAVGMSFITLLLIISFYYYTRHQQNVAYENKRYNTLSSLSNEYFYEYDGDADMLKLSEKSVGYFGCDRVIEGFGRQLDAILPEDRRGIWSLGKHLMGSYEEGHEAACEMPDGSCRWFMIFSLAIAQDKHCLIVGKIADIQMIKAEQIRLKQLASTDGLTGIYNITAVKKRIETQLETMEPNQQGALLLLDIDDFKGINDRFGHYMGDTVLVQFAGLITGAFPSGLVGRLGGDEFVVFVLGLGQQELERQCRMLCENFVHKTSILMGESFSCSIGITAVHAGQSYNTLYKTADKALYQTKERQKNGFTFAGQDE